MTIREEGRRFSHVYGIVDTPFDDSETARFRLAKLMEKSFPRGKYQRGGGISFDYMERAIETLESELGVRFSQGGISSWQGFFRSVPKSKLLDALTLLFPEKERYAGGSGPAFIRDVRRILSEENLAYEMDDAGGIHPLIDGAFSATKQSAVSALSGERYKGTASLVEQVDVALLQEPTDYVGAIRAIFGANENLFKMMFSVPRLDAKTAGEKIGPIQQSHYTGHPTLTASSSKILESFKDWINGAHFYRHEQGVQSPSQPSEEFAILMISQGLSYVRWLAQLDRK
ncbi:hypothetical protein [Sulfitobacter geojensis]|uniref:hypothetical protein n=1 Tax=Sulfitobacter geojensis TaxID=1342299 RepID=UPI0007D8D885|nr:hypothetical protein [Sulfitobacter geojensis]OAN98063.1 hypothetical protein A8B74_01640 [Sulfitobacter geojensis]